MDIGFACLQRFEETLVPFFHATGNVLADLAVKLRPSRIALGILTDRLVLVGTIEIVDVAITLAFLFLAQLPVLQTVRYQPVAESMAGIQARMQLGRLFR